MSTVINTNELIKNVMTSSHQRFPAPDCGNDNNMYFFMKHLKQFYKLTYDGESSNFY